MRFRVGAYGVIVQDRKILLAHWNAHGRSGWTLPGGGIEAGEDPYEAAVREIREETGYEASIDQMLGVDSIVVNARNRKRAGKPAEAPLQNVRIVYLASIVGGELRHEVDGTTDEAKWFDLSEVKTLQTVSLVKVAMRLYHERPRNGHLERLPRRRR
ncbi:NUDIX hydrolase [Gulosibacter sp. 10]|uniref:NUDIX hydrolase n=1 Tax=Gulosibacter sp. 10 TaxID=1255570 RepID=UPI00097E863A|nr:NUDIX domain-containing protein [Gulosibacter sp. 10]SJM63120.1 MutT-like domain protein [Gulosibacter sp. 10]